MEIYYIGYSTQTRIVKDCQNIVYNDVKLNIY